MRAVFESRSRCGASNFHQNLLELSVLLRSRAVAQLVARFVRDEEVAGSSPASPISLVFLVSPLHNYFRAVAQRLAHLLWEQGVVGSNPTSPIETKNHLWVIF